MKFRKIFSVVFAAAIAVASLSGCTDNSGIYSSEEPSASQEEKLCEASADDFEYTEKNGSVIITKYIGEKTELAVPEKINGKPVVEIGNKAFCGKTDLKRVEIPETVTKIGKNDSLKFYEGEEQNDEKLVVTGLNLKSASAVYDSNYGEYNIWIELDEEGAKKFAEATERLAETGGIISIRLDGEKLSAPRVHEKISNGKMNISGNFTVDSAVELAQKMNGNPFEGCKDIEVKYKGKTYGYDALDEFLLAVNEQ